MAGQDCNAAAAVKEVTETTLRHYTVSYASTFPDYERIPLVAFKGKWLDAAGFATGTPVDVRVMPGCLVVTAREPEPQGPELMQSLRKVCKFSARKQRQVQEFIEIVSGNRER